MRATSFLASSNGQALAEAAVSASESGAVPVVAAEVIELTLQNSDTPGTPERPDQSRHPKA
jgi:3-hydroxyisobutyrate dehydrogenase-like beta-hydroxyacid dehydrogenase